MGTRYSGVRWLCKGRHITQMNSAPQVGRIGKVGGHETQRIYTGETAVGWGRGILQRNSDKERGREGYRRGWARGSVCLLPASQYGTIRERPTLSKTSRWKSPSHRMLAEHATPTRPPMEGGTNGRDATISVGRGMLRTTMIIVNQAFRVHRDIRRNHMPRATAAETKANASHCTHIDSHQRSGDCSGHALGCGIWICAPLRSAARDEKGIATRNS